MELQSELSGSECQAKALEANEAGDFLGALGLVDQAMIGYGHEEDFAKSVEVRAMRGNILRRISSETGDPSFLIDAKHTLMGAIEMARVVGDESALSLPLFEIGKTNVKLSEYEEAAESFEAALLHLPQSPHNRPSVEADMEANLETTKLALGDESAHERALESISAIAECEDANEHEKGVWMAGGFMRLAEILQGKDNEKASEYMARASEIIEKDPDDFKLIKADYEKLKEKLGL